MAQPNDPSTEQTLKKVLDVLSKAFPAAGSRAVGGGKTERNESSTSSDRSDKVTAAKQQKIIVATARSLDKLSGAANRSANSLTGVSKQSDKVKGSFVGLNSSLSATMKSLSLSRAEIRKINFGGIAGEIEKAVAQSMEGLKEPKEKVSAGKVVSRFGDLMDNRVNPRLEKFTRVLRLTSNALIGFMRELRDAEPGKIIARRPRRDVTQFPDTWSIDPNAPPASRRARRAAQRSMSVVKPAPKKELDLKLVPKEGEEEPETPKDKKKSEGAIADWVKAKYGEGKALRAATLSLGLFATSLSLLKRAGLEVLDDMFHVLAARGYGTTDSLTELYGSSILAGMALRDFVQMMDENMIAVSRASSFASFQKNLKVGTDGLQKFGVFGDDAARLSATMMSASTSLGIPQAQMEDAVKAQTASFAKLRKTTNITANEFRELSDQIASNAQVRTELSALDPADRLRRQTEILDQAAYARSLNLSKTEVQKFTQSILEQRKSTVKQRFQQAGRLTQAAGMLGMDQGKVDELRKLAMNKYKTEDEQKRYLALKGEINTGLERMQQSGQPGSQFQADIIRENLETAGINDLDVAAAARAAEESGKVAKPNGTATNKDIGKELEPWMQGIGATLTSIEGLMKNPFGAVTAAIVTGIGGILLAIRGLGVPIGTSAGTIIAGRMGLGGPDLPGSGGKGKKQPGKPGANTPTGIEAPDWSTSKGADGSGGDTKGSPKASPKGKWGARIGGIGRGLGKAVPYVGSAISIGMAGMEYSEAEEAAKPENGGDGDVGKKKGEAVGSGVGSTVGAIAGGVVGAIGGPLGIALGASLGGILGDFTGRLLGGFFGSESAAEKAAKAAEKNRVELKKNTDEMIKARRVKAGPDVITTDNLGSITQNALQTAKAYSTPDAAELAKFTDSKKTPEQRAKEKADKEAAAIAAMPQDQKNALLKQARNEVYDGSNPNANEGDVNKRFKELMQKKAEATVAASAGALAAVAVPQPATPVQQAPAVIATPASQVQGSVNPTAVNKADVEAQAAATKKVVDAAIQSPTALSDPGEVLKQILEILKQSLVAENQQVELASTMLRAQSLTPYLPDKQSMVRRVMSQV